MTGTTWAVSTAKGAVDAGAGRKREFPNVEREERDGEEEEEKNKNWKGKERTKRMKSQCYFQ